MLRRWKTMVVAALASAGSLLQSGALADVHLKVNGVRNAKGKVYVLVFDNAAAYEAVDFQRAVDFAEINAAPGTLTHVFKGLDAGPYAVMLFHDENGDGDLNMDGQTPLEGFGLSGSSGKDDLPGFKKASFRPGPVSVNIFYLK